MSIITDPGEILRRYDWEIKILIVVFDNKTHTGAAGEVWSVVWQWRKVKCYFHIKILSAAADAFCLEPESKVLACNICNSGQRKPKSAAAFRLLWEKIFSRMKVCDTG